MIFSLFAALAIAAPAPVKPVTPKPVAPPVNLTQVRGWDILRMPNGQCRTVAAFGPDKALVVWVNTDGSNGVSLLIDHATYRGGETLALVHELGDRSYSGGDTLVVADGTIRVLDTRMDAGFLTQLRRSRRLAVFADHEDYEYGDAAPIASLTLDDMAPVVDALVACTGRPVIAPAAPTSGPVTKPQFLNKADIITSGDYPKAALRANAQGTVRYRIAVTPSGTVSDCTIVSSSGNADLDAQTCTLLRRRARLTPAKDVAGKPIAGTFEANVFWRVPG